MKKNLNLLMLVIISAGLLISGCSKETKNVIDCIAESLLVKVEAIADASDSKIIHFEAKYTGSLTVSSVVWDYGDGSSETLTTTTAMHTYLQGGNYTVKTKVKLIDRNSSCTPEPTKAITVN